MDSKTKLLIEIARAVSKLPHVDSAGLDEAIAAVEIDASLEQSKAEEAVSRAS